MRENIYFAIYINLLYLFGTEIFNFQLLSEQTNDIFTTKPHTISNLVVRDEFIMTSLKSHIQSN